MALSGGVDSAVSAALLLEQGYDVHAVFIKVWQPDFLDCTQEDDRKSAKRVAASLGISFDVLDAADSYKQKVIDAMVSSYAQGRTPNPDILCNQYIKFGVLAAYAQEKGFDHIATGHYAQIAHYRGMHCLQKAKDSAKDQVYFLAQVSSEILAKCLFPVGSFLKSETRARAETFALPVFDKKDSQGLCFMGMVDMAEFLAHAIQLKEGAVLNEKGDVVGSHGGAQQFTRGQRHGFSLHTPTTTPHYVVSVNAAQNTITVSDTHTAQQKNLTLESLVTYAPLDLTTKYDIQVRYHGALVKGMLVKNTAGVIEIALEESVTVAPGQIVVIYDNEILVASGVSTS